MQFKSPIGGVTLENTVPNNIEELKKLAADRTSYKARLIAVEELGKFNSQQSKDILWKLMLNDRVHAVQHRAFLKLQAFGETVKLPRKRKGHLVKDINRRLGVVLTSIGGSYSEEKFNKKFKEMYPEFYDIYKYEKGNGFNRWVQNVLASLPKPKA
jgi:hypothetical protein